MSKEKSKAQLRADCFKKLRGAVDRKRKAEDEIWNLIKELASDDNTKELNQALHHMTLYIHSAHTIEYLKSIGDAMRVQTLREQIVREYKDKDNETDD